MPATLVLLAALLAMGAFFNLAEVAMFALQKSDREALRNRSGGALVLAMIREPRTLLASLLIGVEVANIALGAVSAELTRTLVPDWPWLNIVLVAPLVILLADILPKALGIHFARGAALALARPLALWNLAIGPVRWVIDVASALILRLFGVEKAPVDASLREEQLRVLVDRGLMAGALQPIEQQIIHRVFEFGDITVARLMTPRPDVFSLPTTTPWKELLASVHEQRYSRVPMWQGTPDNIVGILLTKDLLRLRGHAPTPRQIQRLLRPALFVPPGKRAQDLLREFRARKQHLAIVVDEHGTCIGLVTLDDLLRELVGDTPDESDAPVSEVVAMGPGRWRVQGAMDVADFAEQLGIDVPEGEWTTVAGFVLHQLGSLPKPGATVTWDADGVTWTFRVRGLVARRIAEVEVSRADATAPEPAGAAP